MRKLPREGYHKPDNPAWSPDGRRIPYIRGIGDDFGNTTQLHILDFESGADASLSLRRMFPPTSPGGRTAPDFVVQATTDRVRHNCLYVVPLEGGTTVSCDTKVYGFAMPPHQDQYGLAAN